MCNYLTVKVQNISENFGQLVYSKGNSKKSSRLTGRWRKKSRWSDIDITYVVVFSEKLRRHF